ncbi:hypothetical protein RSJ42_09790 [Methanosarcina hadiensis]|uniref:hypothetical protein n=1 Tax=Methanosarcina hadiensis TaxID=3078083 RepID=UPI00397752E8
MDRDTTLEKNIETETKTNRDITLNKNIENDKFLSSCCPYPPDIPFPKTDNILHLILHNLNQDIAAFYMLVKFSSYIPEGNLGSEILKRSMGIHKNFANLFLFTKGELVFVHPEFLEVTERLLFKGQECRNFMNYTHRLCGAINDYKIALQREGYLPNPRRESILNNI